MYYKIIKTILFTSFFAVLSACTGFFDKDNTPPPSPLTPFLPEISPRLLWGTQAGLGFNKEFLKVGPTLGENAIFTTSSTGTVTSVAKANGALNWQINTGLPLSTSPGVGEGLVVVGSRRGDVVALDELSGSILWRITIAGEILAKPAVGTNIIVIKTTDGYIRALDLNGKEKWSYQEMEPNLILRAASDPLIVDRSLIVGFANGNLGKFSLRDGQSLWLTPLATPEGAFAVQRMIDIDANPMVYKHQIYAATFQGKIAALEWISGRKRWIHDLSSYTGMTADQNTVFVSDANSYVWSFAADDGAVNWRQDRLYARVITGPAKQGDYIVVGDAEGFLHWISKKDGHFGARLKLGPAIYAAPVAEHDIVYTLTNTGYLAAYVLG